ncbi:MAG: hypothetical protein CMJ61_02605, partial [Planctomycetaceae bacterium]|nr:hypothetical protein [Planctomycetaceae bacterium]
MRATPQHLALTPAESSGIQGKKQAEESRIEVRNIRRDIMEKLRAMERNKEISQDENRRYQEQLQKLTDAFTG